MSKTPTKPGYYYGYIGGSQPERRRLAHRHVAPHQSPIRAGVFSRQVGNELPAQRMAHCPRHGHTNEREAMNTLTKEHVEILKHTLDYHIERRSDLLKSFKQTKSKDNAMSDPKVQRDLLEAHNMGIEVHAAAIATAVAYDELKAKYEALRAKVPDGWTPVTFEKGDMVIDQLKDGTWMVEKPAHFCGLTESGEWKQSYRERFNSPHEAAQAAEKAGEQ